jgi:hypothetical protein
MFGKTHSTLPFSFQPLHFEVQNSSITNFVTKLIFCYKQFNSFILFAKEVFYDTQYDPTVVRSYYRFLRLFPNGYNGNLIDILFGKKSPLPLILSKTFHIFHFLYYNNIIIFDNTLILPIRPLNTTVRQLKKPVVQN